MPYKNIETERSKARERYAKNKRTVFALLGGCCSECQNPDEEVLQIDHVVPIKRKTGSRGESGWKAYQKIMLLPKPLEIFQLLCANCHMKKSKREVIENVRPFLAENHWNWKGGYEARKEKGNAWYRNKRAKQKL